MLLHKLNTPSFTKPGQNIKVTPTIFGLYSVIIHCNNQGAIGLVKNPQAHSRKKHIDIQ